MIAASIAILALVVGLAAGTVYGVRYGRSLEYREGYTLGRAKGRLEGWKRAQAAMRDHHGSSGEVYDHEEEGL